MSPGGDKLAYFANEIGWDTLERRVVGISFIRDEYRPEKRVGSIVWGLSDDIVILPLTFPVPQRGEKFADIFRSNGLLALGRLIDGKPKQYGQVQGGGKISWNDNTGEEEPRKWPYLTERFYLQDITAGHIGLISSYSEEEIQAKTNVRPWLFLTAGGRLLVPSSDTPQPPHFVSLIAQADEWQLRYDSSEQNIPLATIMSDGKIVLTPKAITDLGFEQGDPLLTWPTYSPEGIPIFPPPGTFIELTTKIREGF